MEQKEEVHYWLDLLFHEEYRDWDDWDEYGPWGIDWYDYMGSGIVHNMNEYHQMKVLTLLRKFDIPTARYTTEERGW